MKKFLIRFGISILVCFIIILILNNKTFTIKGNQVTPHLREKSIGLKIEGQEEITLYWKDGSFLGKQYYENGNLKMECNFALINNSITEDGPCNLYYENGSLQTEGNFVNSQQEGIWKQYYENGLIMAEMEFSEGVIQSSTCYDERGKKFKCDLELN